MSEGHDLTPPLKWFGGKHYLAPKFIAMFPEHVHYVEPFAGGLAVLLAKDPQGVSEVVNDLNCELSNFWTALQCEECFTQFQRRVEATPFSEVEWEGAAVPVEPTWDKHGGMMGLAVNFFIRCRQSRAGQFKDFATLSRSRTRRGMNEQASAWLTAVEGLPAIHARLKRVVVLNRPAVDVIRQQDGESTFFYLDPPYLHSTRTGDSDYAHEMTETQHAELLTLLGAIKGKFMLSGYQSELYAQHAAGNGWRRVDFDLPNNAAGGKEKRRMCESVWMNY